MSDPVLERLAELEARVDALEMAARPVITIDQLVERAAPKADPPEVHECPGCCNLIDGPIEEHRRFCSNQSVS